MPYPHVPYWPSFHGPRKEAQHEENAVTDEDRKERALRYLKYYGETTQEQVRELVDQARLSEVLLKRYPHPHEINSNKLLRSYVNQLKNTFLRSSARLTKICFDDQLHLVHHALGTQSFISLPHGGKLKTRRELRISSLFKRCPEPLLRMIAVHELAHLREKDHNDAFYRLCVHMEPTYHQLEFDARLYLIHQELFGPLYADYSSGSIPSSNSP